MLNLESRPALEAAALGAHSRRRGEPTALAQARLRALEVYRALEAPDRVRHLWRYTDPAALLPRTWELAAALHLDAAAPAGPGTDGAPGVVLGADGSVDADAAARASGVQLLPLAQAGVELNRVGAAVPAAHGLLEALNAAAWTGGLLVRIPRRTVTAAPLRVRVPAAAGLSLPRLLIVAESGAEATVIEEHSGGADGGRVLGVSELFVEPGARLSHVLVQRWAGGVSGHLTLRARLERDAELRMALAALGGERAKLDLGAVLAGEGARSELAGVVLGEGRQHLDHHTLHEHRAGRTWSNLDFKAVLTGRARSVYTGLIRIEKGAPGSEAYQENRNLLLSERCRADTIPELEILTDEVTCTHGATAAPVDPEQLFYLRSRGLPGAEALRLVVRGFLEATLRRLPAALRDELEVLIAARLAAL